MITFSRLPKWLLPNVALCAVLALASISYRYRVESKNHAVTITTEVETVQSLAAAQGLDVNQAVQKLKQDGLNSLTLSEQSVGQLVSSGDLAFDSGQLFLLNPAIESRLMRGMKIRFPAVKGEFTDFDSMPTYLLRSAGLGLSPTEVAIARRNGLLIVGRYANPPGLGGRGVAETIRWAKEQGVNVFLPMGDQVLGRKNALKDLSEAIESSDMLYATPEFAKIGGDANIVSAIPGHVVRLHSAQVAELDKMTLPAAVERYAKAARERGMRVLLVRPTSFSGEKPLDEFGELIDGIQKELKKDGLKIAAAHPNQDAPPPQLLLFLLGLSIVPVAVFVGASFVQKQPWQMAGIVLVTLLALGSWSSSFRPYMALIGAIVFPLTAYVVMIQREGKNWLLEFLLMSAISLVGGLCVAGLLNALPYWVQAAQFPGVKFAHFLPILLIGWYLLQRLGDLRGWLRSPITWGALGLAFFLLVALAFMLARTGNDNPAAVSGMELKFRAILDMILPVRPRTKEFLIGHPLLILGLERLIRIRKGEMSKANGFLAAILLTVGAIGQTSIVNTLCHLHSPVALALMRIGIGVVVGILFGAVLLKLTKKVGVVG